MAGVSTEPGSNGNKLDVDLNLVPFIDLLSTLVLFLLLSVIWVQIGAIPVGIDSKGQSSVSQTDQSKLVVTVTTKRLQLTWPSGLASRHLPGSVDHVDRLSEIVKTLVQQGQTPPATVAGEDGVSYGSVIRALDVLKVAGLTNVSLNTD